MRTSPEYLSTVRDLVEASATAPSFEIENAAAAICAAHGVSMDDLCADMDAVDPSKG